MAEHEHRGGVLRPVSSAADIKASADAHTAADQQINILVKIRGLFNQTDYISRHQQRQLMSAVFIPGLNANVASISVVKIKIIKQV